MQKQTALNLDDCTGCGLCSKVCVAHNLVIVQNKANKMMDNCVMCGQCSAVCPQRAISLEGCGNGQIDKTDDIRLVPEDNINVIRFRRSIRNFKKTEIPKEAMERILEAGRMAPSACNAQPWKFVVITDRELALKIGKAAAGLGMNKFAKDAPVHILVVEESANITSLLGGKVKDKHFPLIDIGIAAAHITLAAESEGLGSCILGWFDEKEMKRLTGIPASKRVLLDIAIGYPVKEKRKKMRKPKEKVVSYNHY